MGPDEVPSWGYPEVIELGELGELRELDDVDELDELIRDDLSPPLALTPNPERPSPQPFSQCAGRGTTGSAPSSGGFSPLRGEKGGG
jgi:hypothetical protein